MSNTGKILRKNLHPVIDKNNQEIVNLTEASADMFDSARTSINDSQDEINITTASGIWLDRSGIDLGDGRTPIDSDESYRPRLKGALLGRGVVRPRIENAVNSLLGEAECSIVKWDEAAGVLPVYGFAVDLPVFDVEGFYLDDEGDDEEEDGAYLDISAYCCD